MGFGGYYGECALLMMNNALFEGLVFDERDEPLKAGYVGDEAVYILDDDGFKKHITAQKIDRAIFSEITGLIKGHEDRLSDQAASMLGTEDVFSKALIEQQLKNIDGQFNELLKNGIPSEMRAYLGMSGFKVIVDHHGDILEFRAAGSPPIDE